MQHKVSKILDGPGHRLSLGEQPVLPSISIRRPSRMQFAFVDANRTHARPGYGALSVWLERALLTARGLSIEVCHLAASGGHTRRAVTPWHVTPG
jgi:hypothetical protein